MKLLVASLTAIIMTATAMPAQAGSGCKEVRAAFTTWRDALASRKPENIVQLYADDAVLLATLADKPIRNQKERVEYFKGLMQRPELKATLNEEHVRMLDEDDAVVSGIYTFSFKDGAKTVNVPARYSFVFEKQYGEWRIVEHHSSKLPSAQ